MLSDTIAKGFGLGRIVLVLGLVMIYTHWVLRAYVEYYNEFIAEDDEYYYVELDDIENEVENDEDENWYSRISKRIL